MLEESNIDHKSGRTFAYEVVGSFVFDNLMTRLYAINSKCDDFDEYSV